MFVCDSYLSHTRESGAHGVEVLSGYTHSPMRRAIDFSDVRALMEELHKLDRSHNSPGFSEGLGRIAAWIRRHGFRGSTRIISIPAGGVYNYWRVPKRWVVKSFRVTDEHGATILDRTSHPLTLMPFSDGFRGRLSRQEFLEHVHSRDDLPDAVPWVFRKLYRHWESGWGFALPSRLVPSLNGSWYDVEINASFEEGPMEMLEYSVPGKVPDLVHVAAHLDHTGQANDGLSGVLGALCVIRDLEASYEQTSYSYSVLICPEIVGSAVYLATESEVSSRLRVCLCPNMLGHDAPVALCLSKSATSILDQALRLALLSAGVDHVEGPWRKYADCGDEISYDSPGINIPTSTISRVGELFREYHTSLDTTAMVDRERFEQAVDVMALALSYLDRDRMLVRRFTGNPSLASPELSLYLDPLNVGNRLNMKASTELRDLRSGQVLDPRAFQEFFLSNLDGAASIMDIANAASIRFEFVESYAQAFEERGLIELRPATDRRFAGKVVRVALTGSGLLSLA